MHDDLLHEWPDNMCCSCATAKTPFLVSFQTASTSLDRLTCTGAYSKVTVLIQRGGTCCIMPSTLLQQVPVQRQQLHSLFYAGGEAAAGLYLLSQGLLHCYMC